MNERSNVVVCDRCGKVVYQECCSKKYSDACVASSDAEPHVEINFLFGEKWNENKDLTLCKDCMLTMLDLAGMARPLHTEE